MRFTKESFTPEEWDALQAAAKSCRGVEFIYKTKVGDLFNGSEVKAYVAAADPLKGVTVKPIEPHEKFDKLDVPQQYLYCLVAQRYYTKSALIRGFLADCKLFASLSVDSVVDFVMIAGEAIGGSWDCPFS